MLEGFGKTIVERKLQPVTVSGLVLSKKTKKNNK